MTPESSEFETPRHGGPLSEYSAPLATAVLYLVADKANGEHPAKSELRRQSRFSAVADLFKRGARHAIDEKMQRDTRGATAESLNLSHDFELHLQGMGVTDDPHAWLLRSAEVLQTLGHTTVLDLSEEDREFFDQELEPFLDRIAGI